VLLLTTRSWLGKEDYELEADLRAELTGILNWSLDGLRRLTLDNENHFTRFEAAEEAITTMRDLASPVGAFVRERCKLDPNAEIAVDDLYAEYKDWCQVCEYPKSPKAHFGRDLRAACPSVRKTRPRDGSKRSYVYASIRLRTDKDEDEPELPLSKADNKPVARTTRTTGTARGSLPASGPSGPSDQLNVAPVAAVAPVPGKRGDAARPKSDDLPYDGPVVAVPDLGPDAFDEHGVPLAAQSNGPRQAQPGVSARHIHQLGDQYKDRAYANSQETGGDTRTTECDAWLRQRLADEGVLPENIETEFKRVMAVVFGGL
jgi:hypothetical protein